MISKYNICGLPIHNVTAEEALAEIDKIIARRRPCYVTNPNVDVVVRCRRDPEFLGKYYSRSALSLADGVPILWAARWLGTPLKEKISCSDFVPKICAHAQQKGFKVFLLGGRPGAATAARDRLWAQYPGLKVTGVYSPPFGFENDAQELEKIARLVQAARPDIVFVGLGVPKQEQWIDRYAAQLNIPLCLSVGVTFEFIAGIVKRAPRWMQAAGLEWSWRLMMEPRRLWKRYLIDDMAFFALLLKQKLGKL